MITLVVNMSGHTIYMNMETHILEKERGHYVKIDSILVPAPAIITLK